MGVDPVVNHLRIVLVPADGEQARHQPRGDLLTAPGPHLLELVEVASGELGGQMAMSIDGEARDEGVNVVVAQGRIGEQPIEDRRLELRVGASSWRLSDDR